jgi:hypothetical protein
MSIPNYLLDKLTTNISKSETDGFTLRFEEHRDESIPLMLEKIKDNNQVVRNNAAAVLSQIGDQRIFTQLMTYLEEELKWGAEPYLSRYVRSIARRDPETQRLMLAELEKYLEQNPLVPRVNEQKYKNFFTIIDNLWIIRNPYVISILEKLISRKDQLLDIPHRALLALSDIDRERASISLRNFMGLSGDRDKSFYTNKMKVLNIRKQTVERPDYFSISTWVRDEYQSKEAYYPFKHENGLVYFVYGGTDKRFAGQAQNDEDAIQVATEYLAWWLSSINAI